MHEQFGSLQVHVGGWHADYELESLTNTTMVLYQAGDS